MKCGESVDSKPIEIGPSKCHVYPFWINLYFSWTHIVNIHSRICQMYLLNQPNVSKDILNQTVSQWALKSVLAIYLKYITNQSCIDNPQGLFILISISSSWPILFSFNLSQIQLLSLIQFWSYIELLKLFLPFNHSISIFVAFNYSLSIKVIQVCESHLLIIHTYNYIYKHSRGLVYCFSLCIKFY